MTEVITADSSTEFAQEIAGCDRNQLTSLLCVASACLHPEAMRGAPMVAALSTVSELRTALTAFDAAATALDWDAAGEVLIALSEKVSARLDRFYPDHTPTTVVNPLDVQRRAEEEEIAADLAKQG